MVQNLSIKLGHHYDGHHHHNGYHRDFCEEHKCHLDKCKHLTFVNIIDVIAMCVNIIIITMKIMIFVIVQDMLKVIKMLCRQPTSGIEPLFSVDVTVILPLN